MRVESSMKVFVNSFFSLLVVFNIEGVSSLSGCNELEKLVIAERASRGGGKLICDSKMRSVANQHLRNQFDYGVSEIWV